MRYDVFISYSTYDFQIAKLLAHQLNEYDITLWFDQRASNYKTLSQQQIYYAIDTCTIYVFLISNSFLNSKEHLLELQYAIGRNKYIIPVLIERSIDPSILKYKLEQHTVVGLNRDIMSRINQVLFNRQNWINFEPFQHNERLIEELVSTIQSCIDLNRQYAEFLGMMLHWEKEGRIRSLLLAGDRLARADKWLHRTISLKGMSLNDTLLFSLHEYINQSRFAQRRKYLYFTAVFSTLIAIFMLIVAAQVAILSVGNAASATGTIFLNTDNWISCGHTVKIQSSEPIEVKEYPNLAANVEFTLSDQDEIEIIERTKGQQIWYRVKSNHNSGWISGFYAQTILLPLERSCIEQLPVVAWDALAWEENQANVTTTPRTTSTFTPTITPSTEAIGTEDSMILAEYIQINTITITFLFVIGALNTLFFTRVIVSWRKYNKLDYQIEIEKRLQKNYLDEIADIDTLLNSTSSENDG